MKSAVTSETLPPSVETPSTLHSYNVRVCHWINVVACAYLLWSGMSMFLDFPALYWGHTGFQGYPALFSLEDWGLSWEEAGALASRRVGRTYHFTSAWVFLINGLVYVGWSLYSTHFRNRLLPVRDELSVAHVRKELRDHLRWRSRGHAPDGRYGTLQKTTYLILIFVFVPLMMLTGIAQAPGFTAAMPFLLDLFGGRQTARTLHAIGTVMLMLFVAVHVLQVAAAGFFLKVRSMITGR